jgi:hypothetical protein
MRYSLLSLLWLNVAIAVLCGIFFGLPDTVGLCLLSVLALGVFPAATVAGIIYGHGYVRAFLIGCLAAMGWTNIAIAFMGVIAISNRMDANAPNDEVVFKVAFAIFFTTTVLCGLLAMGIRWLCLHRRAAIFPADQLQPTPSSISIEPRDKAELYTILQGRMRD